MVEGQEDFAALRRTRVAVETERVDREYRNLLRRSSLRDFECKQSCSTPQSPYKALQPLTSRTAIQPQEIGANHFACDSDRHSWAAAPSSTSQASTLSLRPSTIQQTSRNLHQEPLQEANARLRQNFLHTHNSAPESLRLRDRAIMGQSYPCHHFCDSRNDTCCLRVDQRPT